MSGATRIAPTICSTSRRRTLSRSSQPYASSEVRSRASTAMPRRQAGTSTPSSSRSARARSKSAAASASAARCGWIARSTPSSPSRTIPPDAPGSSRRAMSSSRRRADERSPTSPISIVPRASRAECSSRRKPIPRLVPDRPEDPRRVVDEREVVEHPRRTRAARSSRPPNGSTRRPKSSGLSDTAIALIVKSRRKRSSRSPARSTVGSAPGAS